MFPPRTRCPWPAGRRVVIRKVPSTWAWCVVCLCVMLPGAAMPAAGQPADSETPAIAPAPAADTLVRGEGPLVYRDEAVRIALPVPAPYWDVYGRDRMAAGASGGCGGGQIPPDLLCVLSHKDAECWVEVRMMPRTFLMRSKDDLESFVNAITQEVKSQLGEQAKVTEAPNYIGRDDMIVHRMAFEAPLRGASGGGCAPPAPATGKRMTHLLVDCFLRRADGEKDARHYELHCVGASDAFEQLRPEVEAIVAGFRYTGPVMAVDEFYVSDAPEDKLLTPTDARPVGGREGGGRGWLWAVALVMFIWMLRRRRKPKAAS